MKSAFIGLLMLVLSGCMATTKTDLPEPTQMQKCDWHINDIKRQVARDSGKVAVVLSGDAVAKFIELTELMPANDSVDLRDITQFYIFEIGEYNPMIIGVNISGCAITRLDMPKHMLQHFLLRINFPTKEFKQKGQAV